MSSQKSLLEVMIMPLVIAGTGFASTYHITRYQAAHTIAMKTAEEDAARIRAKRDQELKVLEIFGTSITNPHAETRKLAVGLLGAVEADLGNRLAAVIANTDPDPAVQAKAKEVATAAGRADVADLIEAFSGPYRRSASDRLLWAYENGDESHRTLIANSLTSAIVPDEAESSYRINLYVARTLSRFRPKWTLRSQQRSAVEALRQSKNYADPTFRARVNEVLQN